MTRLPWFKLALALALGLGLAAILLAVPGGSRAQPTGAGADPAQAQCPIIDPSIDVWSDGHDNGAPAVAYNGRHDEYLVVWYTEQDTDTYDIWAQRVRSDGGLEGGFAVAGSPGETRSSPAVVYSPEQDQYLIAYTNSYTGGGSDCDVYATRISWDGSWASGEFTITDAADMQLLPAVAYNSHDDEYLVVYVNQWAGGLIDVYARRVRAGDGQLVGQNTVASGVSGSRSCPAVAYCPAAYDGEGGYLITYQYHDLATSDSQIRSKPARADLAGLWLSSEITVCPTSNQQYEPAVAAGPDEYLVVWAGNLFAPFGVQLRGRRMGTGGSPQGDAAGFDVGDLNTVFEAESQLALAHGEGYGYLVTHNFEQGPSPTYTLYGRYVLSGHDSASGSQFAIDYPPGSRSDPAVACAPSGDCLVAYSWWDGSDLDIKARFVRPHRIYLPLVVRNG